MNIHIVIGKNFGDEGKGLATDYFALKAECSGSIPLVVRHNGGAQAGHTVDLPDNRFIFHQLSSGSFRHADTYWADTYLPDMYQLSKEIGEFYGISGIIPRVFADGRARCATVIDVIINQALESNRGDGRHGSCGMGIDETVRRSATEYIIPLGFICSCSADELFRRLVQIRDEYVPVRLSQVDMTLEDLGSYRNLLADDIILQNWAEKAVNSVKYVQLKDPAFIKNYENVIFEGAQGLLLDEMNTEYAPHLTTSRTGLTNPVRIIREIMPDEEVTAEAVYVTRSYVTRHGNGPLPHEGDFRFEDETNHPNDWQGTIRFGYHGNKDEFYSPMMRDIEENSFKGKHSVFVTHLNEISEFGFDADYKSYTRFAEDIP